MDTYYGTQLESTDGTEYGKFEVLLLGNSLGYIDRLEVVCTEVTELWIFDGRVLVTTIGKYDCTQLGLSQCSSNADWKFEGSVYGIELGNN